MIINLKSFLEMYHPTIINRHNLYCNLREHDPDFNTGHGKRFFDAVDRAIARGDFE